MLRQLLAGTLLTTAALLLSAEGGTAGSLQLGESILIRSDNGSRPIKDDAPLGDAADSFLLSPGESFTVGIGSSFFSFADFPEGREQVEFLLEVNPGDSFLSLNLPGGFNLTTDQKETVVVSVSEGDALSIAYGYDAEADTFAFTRFTLAAVNEGSIPRFIESETAIPEPSMLIATGVIMLTFLVKKLD
ncbi:MAG: hypothetical protein AAF283_13800 [Cyanobacteria bacterium P01_A01_bin.70]